MAMIKESKAALLSEIRAKMAQEGLNAQFWEVEACYPDEVNSQVHFIFVDSTTGGRIIVQADIFSEAHDMPYHIVPVKPERLACGFGFDEGGIVFLNPTASYKDAITSKKWVMA